MTSNDFALTSTYADLCHFWVSEDYELEAREEGGAWEGIDRDQAVDDEGDACYVAYAFSVVGEDYRDPAKIFGAEEVEEFVRVW